MRHQAKQFTQLSLNQNLSDDGMKGQIKREDKEMFDEDSQRIVDVRDMRESIHTSKVS